MRVRGEQIRRPGVRVWKDPGEIGIAAGDRERTGGLRPALRSAPVVLPARKLWSMRTLSLIGTVVFWGLLVAAHVFLTVGHSGSGQDVMATVLSLPFGLILGLALWFFGRAVEKLSCALLRGVGSFLCGFLLFFLHLIGYILFYSSIVSYPLPLLLEKYLGSAWQSEFQNHVLFDVIIVISVVRWAFVMRSLHRDGSGRGLPDQGE